MGGTIDFPPDVVDFFRASAKLKLAIPVILKIRATEKLVFSFSMKQRINV